MNIIKKIKKKLKPEYMNTQFTWFQVKKALKDVMNEVEEPTMLECMKEYDKNYNDGIANLFPTRVDLAKRLFSDGMRAQFKINNKKIIKN